MEIALAFLLILILIWRNKLKEQNAHIQIEDPIDYDHYLYKLTLITEKSTREIFYIAGEGIPRYMIERDFKDYLMKQNIPSYVTEFIDDGKEFIEGSFVSPFTYFQNR